MIQKSAIPSFFFKICWCVTALIWYEESCGQTAVPLNDLSFFQDPGPAWKIVSDVKADIYKKHHLQTSGGTGVLGNVPGKKSPGKDLFSRDQYGDFDLEFDYMMAKGSNSGIYLQGRYEVQLLDSWGVTHPTSGDNGGIYERWDETRPTGQFGYEGYAPRQNVSRAPGLWQRMKISFQAPRFDPSGRKVENARILRVELNGVMIHEDVELFGPTRGAIGDEAARGPLRIQGDHGPVAFRNISIMPFDKPRPKVTDVKYKLYSGRFTKTPDFTLIEPAAEGTQEVISSDVGSEDNEFCLRYTGMLQVNEPGEYNFTLSAAGGAGLLKIGTHEVIPLSGFRGSGSINLTPGALAFEIVYTKYMNWAKTSLGLTISGPGIREFQVSDHNTVVQNPVDPILIPAPENTLLRSFMDLPNRDRVVHAVSMGSPQKIHYTYDLDNGTIIQVWSGEFLDATPMWHSRGDGSARPVGSVLWFGSPRPAIARLLSPQSEWITDTTGCNFRTKGYVLNKHGEPAFRYKIFGASVSDATTVLHGDVWGILRTLTIENSPGNFYVRLAEGKTIELLSETLYLVGDKSYYLRLEDTGKNKPLIRETKNGMELIVPVQSKITYSILF